jgi:SH3-like domain-containing protein
MRRLAVVLLLSGASMSCHAFDFVSVAEPAILYDANSVKAGKLFVATRYLPLERVVALADWAKVRDITGKLFWIEKKHLSSKRYVEVTVPVAAVLGAPNDSAAIMFKAIQKVALEWLGDTGTGWVQVRHVDGGMGYVRAGEVWGD